MGREDPTRQGGLLRASYSQLFSPFIKQNIRPQISLIFLHAEMDELQPCFASK